MPLMIRTNIDRHTPFDPVLIKPGFVHQCPQTQRYTVQVIYQTSLGNEFNAVKLGIKKKKPTPNLPPPGFINAILIETMK